MKLLLTGGTGFIGSRLALEARSLGIDVLVTGQVNTDAERTRASALQASGVKIEQGALQEEAFAQRMVRDRDTVIHLAAAQHEANVPDRYFEEVNVGGTRVLLEASRAAGVRRFLYGSTIGVYGEASKDALDESSPARPANIYGRSKLAAESEVRQAGAHLPISIVRISETYGPGDFRLLKLFKAIDAGKFFTIGRGANLRQPIFVDDLVRGLLTAAEHPSAIGETFVMAGPEVMTTTRMASEIARVLGRERGGMQVPLWPFVVGAVLCEATFKPLGLQPPLHRRRLDFFRKSFVFNVDKARNVIGFAPTIRFEQGAAAAAAWYRAEGLL